MNEIGSRKEDHLKLCASGDVGYRITETLLDEVILVHDPLPELSLDEIDLSCQLFGKTLAAPILISAMTGGTSKTGKINRELAIVAESLGIGLGLGSQRPMLEDKRLTETFAVRDEAKTAVVIGNIGLWQARDAGPGAVIELAHAIGADAMAVHLNPAQELVQPGGDRDFRGGIRAIEALIAASTVPIIVKETGCGIGPSSASKLARAGVRHLDVAGAGGTSWIAVELHRTSTRESRALGELLREWGVPTAVATARASTLGFETLIASGGIVSGLDAARAISLGASAVGIARPVLAAYDRGGPDEVMAYLCEVIAALKAVMLLTGNATIDALRSTPRVIGPKLDSWLSAQLELR